MAAASHAQPRSRSTGLALIAVIVIATIATRLPHLGVGEIDWDEGVYWESLRALRAGHTLGTEVYTSQPPAFLLLAEPPWALLGGSIAAARAVMLGWAIVAILSGAVLGWRLAGPVGGVATAALLAVDPLLTRQSLVLQADGPATALALVSVALSVVAARCRSRTRADLLAAGAGIALALGMLTKLLDMAVVPALGAALLVGPRRARRALMLISGSLVGAAAVLLPVAPAWPALWEQAVGLHLASQGLGFGGVNQEFLAAVRLEIPLLALATAGTVIGLRRRGGDSRRRELTVIGLAWSVGAIAAMAATHPLWPHHAVALSPGIAVLGGVAAAGAWDWLVGRSRVLRRASVGSALLGAAAMLGLGFGALHPAEIGGLIATLHDSTPAAGLVLSDEQFAAAAADRDAPPEFVDTSLTRLLSTRVSAGAIEASTTGRPPVCAVLLATNRLSAVPGLTAWVASHYLQRTNLDNGRILYVRPGCPEP